MAKTKKREKITAPEQDAESVRQQADEAVTAPQAAGDTTAAASDRERIARRAYELYLSRGGSAGGEMDDWLKAEQEVNPSTQRSRE